MGDDDMMPLELQEEVIKRINDLKTLLRCTSVSKSWNSFIKTPEFIADYHIQRQTHHLLVHGFPNLLLSIIDDDDNTFPQNRLSLPLPDNLKRHCRVQGSSLGLFCFIIDYYYYHNYDYDVGELTAVIWNPSIRKSIDVNYRVTDPTYCNKNYRHTFGFGVSPHTNDPMLVKITYSRFLGEVYDSDEEADHVSLDSIPSLPVEVYTLSSRVWTTLSISLPRKTILIDQYWPAQVVIDEFIYWIGYNRELDGNRFNTNGRLILSFDMKTREFIEICLPESLRYSIFGLSKLRESLLVVQSTYDQKYILWKMECGAPNLFSKLYSIKFPNAYSIDNIPLRFRKSGGLVVLVDRDLPKLGDRDSSKNGDLFVYEPDSEDTYKIRIHGCLNYFDSYMETLLLLDQ